MKNIIYHIFVLLFLILGFSSKTESSPTVSYISSEGLYINGGTNYDLEKGDTLKIYKGDVYVALAFISNISRKSAACTIIEKFAELTIGDRVLNSANQEISLIEATVEKKEPTGKKKKNIRSSENYMSGYVSSQHYLITDMSSSSLSSYQPSLRTKLKVENLYGHKIKLQIKHRSRYYNRSNKTYLPSNQSSWTHRIYEFALYSTDKSSPIQWSFGRQSVYQMRGVGFVDGLYIGKIINEKITVGTAFGLEPDNVNQKISSSRKKAGFFIAYSALDQAGRKLLLTAALAGSYIHSFINREYVYLQADYSSPNLRINQSAEFDIHRNARKAVLNKRLELSSYYVRLNYSLSKKYSAYLSYDTRERIRYFDDILTPDSLFDMSSNQGIKLGVRLKPLDKISININTGIRMRSNSNSDNKYASISVSALRFPQKDHR